MQSCDDGDVCKQVELDWRQAAPQFDADLITPFPLEAASEEQSAIA
jgi:hypothetical protein